MSSGTVVAYRQSEEKQAKLEKENDTRPELVDNGDVKNYDIIFNRIVLKYSCKQNLYQKGRLKI